MLFSNTYLGSQLTLSFLPPRRKNLTSGLFMIFLYPVTSFLTPCYTGLCSNNFPPFTQGIDTRSEMPSKLCSSGTFPPSGHRFHTFRRSGATLAFGKNVPLQNIQAHGLWKNIALWIYLLHWPPPSFLPTLPSLSNLLCSWA